MLYIYSVSGTEVENLSTKKKRNVKMKHIPILVKSIVIFALTCIIFWLCRVVFFITWLRNYETIADIMNVFSIISLFGIVLAGIITVVLFFNKKSKYKVIFILGFTLMLFTHLHGMGVTANYGLDVTSATNILDKKIEGEKMYFVINHGEGDTVTLECDKEVYNSIVVEPSTFYNVCYRCLKKDSKKGYLIMVEP